MSAQPFRLAAGGLVDRTQPLAFRFDGRSFEGYRGDTLASALLANGVRFVGRSFKYHRPRGIVSAGLEESGALVKLGEGAESVPNAVVTLTRLHQNLVASSQNRWPSLRFDLLAVNDRLSRFLPAGFYYKTFMWPASGWLFYERFIRRAAGMGTAPSGPDPARYETVREHCDVLVVGSGPAGLAAALTAGRAGAKVMLVEQRPDFGGALRRERLAIEDRPAADWLAGAVAELQALPNVTLRRDATAFGYYDANLVAVVDTSGHGRDGAWRETLRLVRARRVVLATGAIEQPLTFPDNDRPGIMLAGAVRAYLNEYAVAPGRRAVVYTASDDAYRTAAELADAGIEVAAVIDPRAEPGAAARASLRGAGIELLPGHEIVATRGRHRVRSVDVAPAGGGASRRIDCDLVCVSAGWTPAIHLHSQTGARPVYDPATGAFLPGRPVQAECSVGGARGTGDLAGCLSDGFEAGASAAELCGFDAALFSIPRCDDGGFAPRLGVTQAPGVPTRPKKQFVDLQTDVTVADVALARAEGFVSVEHLKRYTTLGMGTDQGKTSNLAGLTLMSALQGTSPGEVGTTTFRPPVSPVTIGALAGRGVGYDYAPVRLTPMHAWHVEVGARLVENGLWLRPQLYPRPGEAVADTVNREVRTVRQSAGLVDVTTLGKIDVQGPDAATFLDRVYANDVGDLEPGRARYSVMLREDGLVMDDGVACRLAADHFHLTASTGHIDHVLAYLELLHQRYWPDLRLAITDVTENWAVMALAGPRARDVLSTLVAEDISNAALPFLGMKACTVGGVPARLFRVSFSGELAYEVNVPAEHGLDTWRRLVAAGTEFGLCPFGTEAMGVLRIEKGFVAGGEIDGRTTPQDLGLGWLLSKSKPYLGKPALARPGLMAPERPRLVGLVPVDRRAPLRAGAHLLAEPAPPTPAKEPVPAIGRITSAAYSATLGHPIALALVSGGRKRRGEIVHAAFPLADECVAVEVVDPAFVDPKGDRARA